jgi:hypothetical protein
MGRLRHVHGHDEILLAPRHLVGRGPACQLRLDEPKLSNVHAELIWDGEGWKLRDLGSRNGTFVAGLRIEPGQLIALEPGVDLAFAGSRACYRLVDAMPPQLLAVADDGEVRVAEGETLFIPDDDEPELTVYCDPEGRWWVESSTDTRRVDEREALRAGDRTWRIHPPTQLPDTRTVDGDLRMSGVELHFRVSRDEEHVELGLRAGTALHRVEPRAHLALLLALARLRLADHERRDLPVSECGWVHRDDLAKMLAIEPALANLWIHRARRQLVAIGVRDSALLIERRSAGTQVRIGSDRIVVEKS